MKRSCVALAVWLATSCAATLLAQPANRQESYPDHPDAQQRPDVPAGNVVEGVFAESQIFPGTTRSYSIYIPAQYQPGTAAALMVFQDGQGYARREEGYRVPNVFDNLIHQQEMPVTIGLFINPGVVPAPNEQAQARFNRSFEYDSIDSRYAEFLVQEMLPLLATRHGLLITSDPNLRAIGGASSGGICAWNVAWHRPDQFRRVFSTIGTFVGLRGGHELSTFIRKVEPKPLRVFLQDGSQDNNIYGGDWWMANQAMLRSLEFAGYEVNHVWGEGAHNGKHGAAIFPDALRWLWHNWSTQPVTTHPDQSQHEVHRMFPESDTWELVSEGHGWAEGLAVTDDGTLYIADVSASKIYRIAPDGTRTLWQENSGGANGLALGPDGRLYGACGEARQIRAWDLGTQQMEVLVENTSCNDLVVRYDGTIYYTDPTEGKVWRVARGVKSREAVDPLANCNGICLSPDQSQLYVADFPGRFIYAYQIDASGALLHKQPFFHAEVPANSLHGHLDGMCCTTDGWLVGSTELGVQIFDPAGRSHAILPMPLGAPRPCYVRFGGVDRRTLYVANVDKVWKRKSTLVGTHPTAAPVKPPAPRL